ncbi:MAG: hypothetical protein RR696_08890 [Clostridia bacterium]
MEKVLKVIADWLRTYAGRNGMHILTKSFRMTACMLQACCIVLFSSMVPAHGSAVTNAANMEDLVFQYCEAQLGYTRDELTLSNLVQTEKGSWMFSLYVNNPDESTDGMVVGEMYSDGKLQSIEGPTILSLYQQLDKGVKKAQSSYLSLYELKQVWEPKVQNLDISVQKEFDDHRKRNPLIDFILHNISLPDASCVSYIDAKEKAQAAIQALPGWKPEMMEHIDIELEVFHIPKGSNRPVYQFVYSLASSVAHMKALLSSEPYDLDMESMLNEERRVFGDALPYVMSIRIDAHTGEQVGEIYIETPPVTHGTAIRFVLWE